MTKEVRKPVQIHTRHLDRLVAKNRMKIAGMTRVNRKLKKNWREFSMDLDELKKKYEEEKQS